MRKLLLTCEHASWALPAGVDLGVTEAQLRSHIGWDEGAAEIARRVAAALGVDVIEGRYSRLFVDLNRPPDHAHVIRDDAWGIAVPGNRGLSAAARGARIDAHHRPHWALVKQRAIAAAPCLHVAIHTFTPAIDPDNRGFDIGVLFDPARPAEVAAARRISAALGEHGLATRDNEPYPGVFDGLTTELRKQLDDKQYAGLELEVSHALSATAPGIERVAAAIAHALKYSPLP